LSPNTPIRLSSATARHCQGAGDETEQQRYYSALMRSVIATGAAVSPDSDVREIPRRALTGDCAAGGAGARASATGLEHFIDNSEALLSSNPKYAPLITSQYVPEYFWNAAAPDRIEAWCVRTWRQR